MRFVACVAIVTLAALTAMPEASAAPLPNAVFADGTGASPAFLALDGPCNGPVTLTLTIDRVLGADEVRVVSAESFMVPDLCLIACFECVVPFAWTLTNKAEGIELAGGGVVPGAGSLQGTFQDGALEVRLGLV
jgi:hypothetical protein